MTGSEFSARDGVSLKEYFDAQLKAYDKAMCLKISAVENKAEALRAMSQVAIDRASETVDERLSMMNEFRGAMRDQAAENVTNATFNAKVDSIEQRIKSLELDRAELRGKASQASVTTAYIISAVGIILSVLSLLSKFW